MDGEAAVIAAGLESARRFKQVSLPALWEISQGKSEDSIGERVKVHALRVIWDIYQSTADPAGLRRRLSEAGEKALASKLEKWNEK